VTRRKALLIIILLVAAGLRLYALGGKSLWLDEIISVRRVRGSFPEMIGEVATHDAHPPLYYVLQYAAKALGGGEAAVRVPSALAGIALVYVVYRIAGRLFDETAGLLAAGLCAVSAFQVYFSQEARPYALAMLLAAVSLWLFLRILDRAQGTIATAGTGSYSLKHVGGQTFLKKGFSPKPLFPKTFTLCIRAACARGRGCGANRAPDDIPKVFEGGSEETFSKKFPPATLHWIIYTLVAGAMLYTYYYLAFALLAEGVILLLSDRRAGPTFKKWLASRAVAAVLFAPYVPVVLGRMSGLPGAPAQSSWRVLAATPSAFVRMLTGMDLAWLRLGAVPTTIIYFAAFVPVGVALFMVRKNRPALTAALTYVLIPVIAVVVLPWRLQIFEAKHLAFVSPILLILGTYAAARCTCRAPAWPAVGLLVFLNAFALSDYYSPQFHKEQWPEACSVIARNARPGDAITFNPQYLGYAFAHYYRGEKLILVQDKQALRKKDFQRLWLVEAAHSNVAIPDPRISAHIRRELVSARFRYAGGEMHESLLPGYKGTIAVRLYGK